MPLETLKRGRGRPKKDGYYASGPGAGGRLDPTNDLFLRTEEREGGPVCPTTSFEDNVKLLFPDKFVGGHTEHPMYPYISKFSFSKTPGSIMRLRQNRRLMDYTRPDSRTSLRKFSA